EFEQGRPLIEAYRARHPDHRVLLTFFSPSGYEVRRDWPGADVVGYLPLDGPTTARRFLSLVRPRLAVFVKYEYWYVYLRELRRRGVPTLLVSALFRPEQAFFRGYGGFFRQVLAQFTHLFVQDEASRTLLAAHGFENVSVSGDTRFDRVVAIADQSRNIALVSRFKGNSPLLVVGSSWPEDWALVRAAVAAHPHLKILVAPHELRETDIGQMLAAPDLQPAVRYSAADKTDPAGARLLVVDRIGLLAALYAYADFAWVGGALGPGLHNTLEAAAHGMPLFFGDRNYEKFREAREMIAAGCAFAVGDAEQLAVHLSRLLGDPTERERLAEISRSYVRRNVGATGRIMAYLKAHGALA
ncbi:MAG: glycosyltransferase N-terminal domain-containing protein, partial [Catalinimonas sp.]